MGRHFVHAESLDVVARDKFPIITISEFLSKKFKQCVIASNLMYDKDNLPPSTV